MTTEQLIAPDERAFRAHVSRASFTAGVDRGQWRVLDVSWPCGLIAISAAPRDGAPSEFVLRFELTGYPTTAPTATPWDIERGAPLPHDLRPKGDIVGQVFRTDWENGRALYAPYDRIALASHPDWGSRHRAHAWNETKDIAFYVQEVWALVNSEDYRGV